jgi:hypothetical protein
VAYGLLDLSRRNDLPNVEVSQAGKAIGIGAVRNKDVYQGIASAMPTKGKDPKEKDPNGVQPPRLVCRGTAAKACSLSPVLAACLKACPNTNLSQTARLPSHP